MVLFSIPENITKLWDAWNVRALVILSLLTQVFLTLFAPLRKRLGGNKGKCVRMLIWLLYLLADWVAGLTVGYILSNQLKSPAKSDDIQTFWAPFLLLHLGGPDTITSFALEDNEFWVRHLLGLILQVGSTLYVFLVSLSGNKLWLPTILVLIASIIKYAERNRAFYLASFDHFGKTWVPGEAELLIPKQFRELGTADSLPDGSDYLTDPPAVEDDDIRRYFADSDRKSILQSAAYLFGTIRNPLLGSFLSIPQRAKSLANFGSKNKVCFAKEALQKMEIQLSLLYEALHTKLPVIVSKTGNVSRILNLGCILGALLSFSLLKKHYKLDEFDAWLTYVLLIGALTLDFISIVLLVFSDWFVIANLHILGYFPNLASRLEARFVKKRRWSKEVPQLNFITFSVKDQPIWLKILATFLPVSLLEVIKVLRCLSSQNFGEDLQYWRPIVEDVVSILQERYGQLIQDSFGMGDRPSFSHVLLSFHIGTELSIQEKDTQDSSSGSTDDDSKTCKLIADYMLYLMMMEPSTMATTSNNWEKVFKDTYEHTLSILGRSSVSNEKLGARGILSADIDNHGREVPFASTLSAAKSLAEELKNGRYSWKQLRKEWVFMMCYAARRCRPNVHSQQPSKGGELLTFIWLCMANYTMTMHGLHAR
ncbi:hypothetical protein SLEP1_g54127 [Rubroshorea leprosula]|uniref:DUF4220 domain-containing protein n=1 Tax=Rubroshorea leprosula TaxID=152421 RepID=A0AAV5MBQ3_9ROSI|nr:hypothetical protein SLEP1_g54127 [Rubroshorea leprosula]